MFSTLSQKTITSFFSKSNDPAKLPPINKKKSVKKETDPGLSKSINIEEDSNSPCFKSKSKKRRILDSDEDTDKDESEHKLAKSKCIEDSDSDRSADERSTPRKKLRTYERPGKLRKRKPTPASESDSFSEHENEEDTSLETKNTPKKTENVTKNTRNTPEKTDSTPKKKENTPEKTENTPEKTENTPRKTINSFFAPRDDKMKKSGSGPTNGTASEAFTPDTYDPNDSKYHPIESAPWKKGEKVPYLALAKTLEAIESIPSRLKMIEILANFFRSVIVLTPSDLLQCTYLCLNKLAPAYEGLELGVGDSVLMKAISQTTGRSVDSIKVELVNKGDLGIIAEASRSNQRTMFKPARLTVRGVYDKLREIAKMSGHSSMAKKVEKIQSLLVACVQSEARYIIRSLGGKLRIGLAEQSLLAALAQAFTLTPIDQEYPPKILDASKKLSADAYKKELDENSIILKTTYCECPCYDAIVPVLLEDGIKQLPKKCKITPGLPIKPMLAHPTKGVQEVLQRFENAKFTCEYKYDGERAQIHVLEGGEVQVYSRNQENNTSKYPDIIARIPKTLKKGTVSCILDTEAVAWDKENKQILPFQILSTRKRKDATEDTIKVQVCIFAFDLLYYNGESLVMKPFQERRSLLQSTFEEIEGEFVFVTSIDSNNVDDIGVFLEEAVKNKCEGLMVKTLDVDATYEIAKRSHNWLKLKKDYLDGVGDTLDLVVIGCYHGKGKRVGTYGGFLLACYDPDNEEFQTICKIGTGFKDEDLAQHSAFFKQHVLPSPKPYYRFDSSLEPDEWVDAVQVWEVKCADLSISPVHKAAAGVVDPQRGISLRFPRFIRIRDDKSPEDATSASQVVSLYQNQEQIKNQQKGTKSGKQEDEEDFY